VANVIIAQRSTDNPRGEPSIGDQSGEERLK
jgi:hypothetical protein